MTITIDDAGTGDLLFGVIIGALRNETHEFTYEVLDVEYFKPRRFHRKEYLKQSSRIVFKLLDKVNIKSKETIKICQGYIFDLATENLLKKYGKTRIHRVRVTGELQQLVEIAYLDEIRNLGYEPIEERETKRGKSFFHMMKWLKKHPDKIIYAKTGWPRLSRYRIFRNLR